MFYFPTIDNWISFFEHLGYFGYAYACYMYKSFYVDILSIFSDMQL